MPSIESSIFSISPNPSESAHRDHHDNFARRDLFEKARDFTAAATHRATDPDGWRQWVHAEEQKFFGIGEGLNDAKEQIKSTVSGACKYVTDDTAWHQIQYQAVHPEIFAQKLADGASIALYAATHQRECFAKVSNSVAISIARASDDYTHMSPRAQGQVIGGMMFGCINPEGNTEALEVAWKVGAAVDRSVLVGIGKSKQAIDEMMSVLPDLATRAKGMLRNYIRRLGLSERELAVVGCPSTYFDEADTTEDFLAMVGRAGSAPEWLRRPGSTRTPMSWEVQDEQFADDAIRQTHDLSCAAAVGAMLSDLSLSEHEFLKRLDEFIKFPERGVDVSQIADVLGGEWTSFSELDISRVSKHGRWAAEFVNNAYFPHLKQTRHVVMVEAIQNGLVRIVDPWEATRYWMTEAAFQRAWNGRGVYLPR